MCLVCGRSRKTASHALKVRHTVQENLQSFSFKAFRTLNEDQRAKDRFINLRRGQKLKIATLFSDHSSMSAVFIHHIYLFISFALGNFSSSQTTLGSICSRGKDWD